MSRRKYPLSSKSHTPFARTLLVVAMASVSYAALAEEEPIDIGPVVVSASGFEQSVKDAPASISVITAEELKKKSFTDVTDALKHVAGVQIAGGG